jgi:hypothetical protein
MRVRSPVSKLRFNLLIQSLHCVQFRVAETLTLTDVPTYFYKGLKLALPATRQKFTMLSDRHHFDQAEGRV